MKSAQRLLVKRWWNWAPVARVAIVWKGFERFCVRFVRFFLLFESTPRTYVHVCLVSASQRWFSYVCSLNQLWAHFSSEQKFAGFFSICFFSDKNSNLIWCSDVKRSFLSVCDQCLSLNFETAKLVTMCSCEFMMSSLNWSIRQRKLFCFCRHGIESSRIRSLGRPI